MPLKDLPPERDDYPKELLYQILESSEKIMELYHEQEGVVTRLIKVADQHLELIKTINDTLMEHLKDE